MKNFLILTVTVILLTACADASTYLGGAKKSEILPGKREEALTSLSNIEIDSDLVQQNVDLERQVANQDWNFSYHMQPLNSSNLKLDAGLANSKIEKIFPSFFNNFGRNPSLPAGLIVKDKIIYFLDSQNQVTAFSLAEHKSIWTSELLKPKFIKGFPARGGVVLSGEFLYVTNGSEYVTALKRTNGEIVWQKKLGNISRLAPTFADSQLMVLAADNKLYALDDHTGDILWTHDGIVGNLSVSTMATINSLTPFLIVPHSSGEIYKLEPTLGQVLWQRNLSSKISSVNSVSITDISVTPIIFNNYIYTGTNSGKFAAIDYNNGEIIFEHDNIYPKNMWVSGDSVVILTQKNELLSFDSEAGKLRWRKSFPTKTSFKYAPNEQILMQGPVIAGDNVWVVDNLGKLYQVNPQNGETKKEINTIKNVTQPLIIEDEKLYLLSDDGELVIYW